MGFLRCCERWWWPAFRWLPSPPPELDRLHGACQPARHRGPGGYGGGCRKRATRWRGGATKRPRPRPRPHKHDGPGLGDRGRRIANYLRLLLDVGQDEVAVGVADLVLHLQELVPPEECLDEDDVH